MDNRDYLAKFLFKKKTENKTQMGKNKSPLYITIFEAQTLGPHGIT